MRATITRHFVRWAYPRNGNLNNPTPTWRWVASVDGKPVNSGDPTLAKARAFLVDYFGATKIEVVREPKPANPYSQSYQASITCDCVPEEDGSIAEASSSCPVHQWMTEVA